jgi:hypothetical protein
MIHPTPLIGLLTFCLMSSAAAAADLATLRFLRTDSFNASSRQPTVRIDQGTVTDLQLNVPFEARVAPGAHTVELATRLPGDSKAFMRRREEVVTVSAGEVVDIEVTWTANLFAGQHTMKVTRVSAPNVEGPLAQLRPAPPPPADAKLSPPVEPSYSPTLTGAGARTWPNGARYAGDFVNGQMHGLGMLYVADGSRYQGGFANDVMHGRGVYVWPNGNRYEGGFANNVFAGRGVFTWSDGNRYVGDFQNGQITGNGEFTWANGNRYVGPFVNGSKVGRGVLTSPNGGRYEGQFSNDRFNGEGVLVTENGRRIEGRFQDGKLVEQKVSQSAPAPSPATTSDSNEGLAALLQILGTAVDARNASRSEVLRSSPPVLPGTVICDTRRTTLGANSGMDQSFQVTCR